jgi:hypothetical protein
MVLLSHHSSLVQDLKDRPFAEMVVLHECGTGSTTLVVSDELGDCSGTESPMGIVDAEVYGR